MNFTTIMNDGPNKIEVGGHRFWLARQLLDSRLTDQEAFEIVAFSPIVREAEQIALQRQ